LPQLASRTGDRTLAHAVQPRRAPALARALAVRRRAQVRGGERASAAPGTRGRSDGLRAGAGRLPPPARECLRVRAADGEVRLRTRPAPGARVLREADDLRAAVARAVRPRSRARVRAEGG